MKYAIGNNMKYLCRFTRHHNSVLPEFKEFVRNEEEALRIGVNETCGVIMDPLESERIMKDLREKKNGNYQVKDPHSVDETEIIEFTAWYTVEEHASIPTYLNFGLGEGPGMDKEENIWFELVEWKPNVKRIQELSKWDKESLINLILELEATA